MSYLYITLIVFFSLEIILQILIKTLRNFFDKSFDWKKNKIITNLITEKDINFSVNKEDIIRNKLFFFDSYLGTTNKENISNSEIFYKNKKFYKSRYNIGKLGERVNTLYKGKSYISSYGDSLTFCRYVNDNETWQFYLSKKLKTNIKNFGVGNYGLDQSYLRFKKNKKNKIDNSKIIIFGFGIETIRRNLSVWKHFFEFGNLYNFKPRYKRINKNKFKFIKNEIKDLEDLYNNKKIFRQFRKYDFFYKNKFTNYLWKFPYSLSLIKNFKRKVLLLIFLTLKYCEINFKLNFKLFKKFPMFKLMNKVGPLYFDFEDKHKLLDNNEAIETTFFIINKILKEKKKTIFVIIPSELDFDYFKRYKKNYYKTFSEKLSKFTNVIDVLDSMPSNIKKRDIYTEEGYGAHFNKKGNYILSNIIFNYLNENKIR